MLMRTDPFLEFDRLTRQVLGNAALPAAMPMEAWRQDGEFVVEFDLPGVDPGTIDLGVERNVLTVRAERRTRRPEQAEVLADERAQGAFTRELILGDALDTEKIQADYRDGVLTLRVPVAEEAKPRKIAVQASGSKKEIDA